jgi:hypothetical protein
MDRKELASQLIETLLKVQEQALDTRQGSNAIGASRLISELTGSTGSFGLTAGVGRQAGNGRGGSAPAALHPLTYLTPRHPQT